MDIESFLSLLLIVFLLILNGMFVASTFALLRARVARIKEIADSGNYSAKLACNAFKQFDAYLTTSLIGLLLTLLVLGWAGSTLAVVHLLSPALHALGVVNDAGASSPISFSLAFALVALLTLFVGAFARNLALRRAEGVVMALAQPMLAFHWLCMPLSLMLNGIVSGIARLAGVPTTDDLHSAHSEEELRMIISASGAGNGGTLGETQAELLDNVIDFGRRLARQVMTHRTEILVLNVEDALEENVRLAQEGGRTRYPVIQEDIDVVIGFVHTKDLFALYQHEPHGDIRSVMREILLVPDTIRGDQLLRRMQRKRQHMAVLVDEYGGTAGLVTISDLLEELVGAWPDEFEPQEEEWIHLVGENTWRIDGRLPLGDLEEAIGRALPCEESCDTVGGYAFWLFDRIPMVGDTASTKGITLTVTEMDSRRVSHVEITVTSVDEEEHEEGGLLHGNGR